MGHLPHALSPYLAEIHCRCETGYILGGFLFLKFIQRICYTGLAMGSTVLDPCLSDLGQSTGYVANFTSGGGRSSTKG